jgi:N-acetylmuramoyl-L-alanine amidase
MTLGVFGRVIAGSMFAACGAAHAPTQTALAPMIVIDPGHPSEVGNGATAPDGTTELRIAWQVAQRLDTLLRGRGYRVEMTKGSEMQTVTNIDRAEIANRAGAALSIRLHCDASSDSGYAVYYPDRTGTAHGKTGPSGDIMRRSGAAAESVHVSMSRMLAGRLKDGGVRGDSKTNIGSQQGALTGSIFSQVPVVLVEMATLTNRRDARFIAGDEGQALIAQAIADGIGRYVPMTGTGRKP